MAAVVTREVMLRTNSRVATAVPLELHDIIMRDELTSVKLLKVTPEFFYVDTYVTAVLLTTDNRQASLLLLV